MVRRMPTLITNAGKAFTVLNFLIAILAFWMVLDPSNRICETVPENLIPRVTHYIIQGDPSLDFWDLLILVGALGGFVLPLLAFIRARSYAQDNRCVDLTISTLGLAGTFYWAGMAYSNLSTDSSSLVFMLALSMMLGCLYSVIVFSCCILRKGRPTHARTTQ